MGSTPTTEAEWRAAGAPVEIAPWIAAFRDLARSYGFTVYTIGNEDHLAADPPEDHTPYSHTPWPGAQPYPFVLALDVMPNPSSGINLADLGQQIENDRQAGVPGAAAIKYLNWTDGLGHCLHDSWEPEHAQRASSDRGHIHISVRTDLYTMDLAGWDPFTEANHHRPVTGQPSGGFDMATVSTLVNGSSGWEVKSLQALLNGHGFHDERGATLAVDGVFGAHTLAAVKAAQTAGGLAVDGEAGPHTRCYLETGHDL